MEGDSSANGAEKETSGGALPVAIEPAEGSLENSSMQIDHGQ